MEPKIHLLPCPFCGAEPEMNPQANAGFYVDCINLECPVYGVETRSYNTPEDAAAKWNTRNTFVLSQEAVAIIRTISLNTGKTAVELIDALADMQQGSFERLKEFGINFPQWIKNRLT